MSTRANPTSVMASFATFKSMAEAKKYRSQYQILAEFIEYIVYKESLFAFIDNEMKNYLYSYFGFDIPEAVIRTAIKSLSYITAQNKIYEVDRKNIDIDNEVESIKQREEEKNAGIIKALKEFVISKGVEDVDLSILTQQLVSYLLEETQKDSGRYVGLISQFILQNENNENIQQQLNAIREGSILYVGLNHNISEVGSIGKPLTLFLDTEVLFDLVGYNGEIWKALALDFFKQIKKANANKGDLKLCYFKEVRCEVDDFFKTAEYIVEGKAPHTTKTAMQAILNGCNSSADIKQKKADFDYRIHFEFSIHEDTFPNYYTPELEKYNLETADITDPKDQESQKFISHIHKLRKGEIFQDTLTSEYILITKTYNTLKKSQELVERYKEEKQILSLNDYAISINGMTSLLWYKLGGGFGNIEYPTNISAILKARTILSSYVSHNIEKEYKEAQQQFVTGEITEEQLAYRVLALKKKPTLPEELEGDSIDEILDFSAEYLRRYEEEASINKKAMAAKDKEIEKLIEKNEEEQHKTKDALTKIASLENQLHKLQQVQDGEKRRKEKQKKKYKYALRVFFYLLLLSGAIWLSYYVTVELKSVFLSVLLVAFEFVGFLLGGWKTLVKGYKKLFNEDMSNEKTIENKQKTIASD